MIKQQLVDYFETNSIPKLAQELDPFWDKPEQILIGKGYFSLLGLTYLLANKGEMVLLGEYDKKKIGNLNVSIYPTDEFGEEMKENEHYVENPEDMIGRELYFTIEINFGEIPIDLSYNIYCEYKFLKQNGQNGNFRSQTVPISPRLTILPLKDKGNEPKTDFQLQKILPFQENHRFAAIIPYQSKCMFYKEFLTIFSSV